VDIEEADRHNAEARDGLYKSDEDL
jgi:hypothetical protein